MTAVTLVVRCVFLSGLPIRIGLVHLEALASCSNAKPLIISNPTVSKAEVSYDML